ncbi:hypothetical protein I2483_13775 [Sporosarcina sp. E16_3]|uniref:hypothetical protein n=1 Tax=Sporosarcina sp. E16_3 TaxID=2789293 RepID=UPI001A915450|nr:hypothetical protein [Sporosarcina sp. E16_3]MBO0602732.1 hypothetical protein [Sporosarcina sp. E16_3]
MTEFTTDLSVQIEGDLSSQIEGDFIAMLDEWFSLPEVYDDKLDSQIHAWYVNPPKVWPEKPYFSPSALGSCPRELYLKAKGAEKDNFRQPPHQSRQKKMGTLTGDMIQREILLIEKHYAKHTGNEPRFKFLRDDKGRPRFEEFAKANVKVSHNGETFNLSGSPDGIMQYTTDGGEVIRVGLEVKSKASTAAKTSAFSMREPDESHIVQTQCYAKMYGCDYYVILYVNLSKKGWAISDEDYAKTPDIRAFCLHVTEADKLALLDKPASITKAVREGTPPPLSLDDWLFNNFKTACALDLSDEEYAELIEINRKMQHSNLQAFKKRGYAEAIEFITEIRKGVSG